MHSNSNKKNQILLNLLRRIIFTKLDLKKVKSQGVKFLKDVSTFESAILLWAKEEYPDYMLFISSFIGPVFLQVSSSMLPGMKKVVDKYFAFNDEVKTKNIELYNEELEESNEMFFQKTIQPMDLLVAKDPFIKKVNQNLIGILNILKPQIQEYSERVLPIMKSAGEKIKEETEKAPQEEDLNQVIDKIKSSKGSFTKLIESLNDFKKLGEELKKYPQELRKIMEDTNIKIDEIKSETIPDLPKLSEDFKNVLNVENVFVMLMTKKRNY